MATNQKVKDETQKISVRVSKSKLEALTKLYNVKTTTELINKLMNCALDENFVAEEKRSVITGIGGKNKLANRIIQLMPPHEIYIEPFGNTASVMVKKAPVKKEVYNDIENGVATFFEVLRDNPMALYNSCSAIPYSEELFNRWHNEPLPEDKLERASRFFFLSRASYLGFTNKYFRSSSQETPKRNFAELYRKECERMWEISKRFEHVEILNSDFRKVLKKYAYNKEAFFLVDPPYYGCRNYYKNEFTWKDHEDLVKLLQKVKGKWMVCHDGNEQIKELYTSLGFTYTRIKTKYASSRRKGEEGAYEKPSTYLYLYNNYGLTE